MSAPTKKRISRSTTPAFSSRRSSSASAKARSTSGCSRRFRSQSARYVGADAEAETEFLGAEQLDRAHEHEGAAYHADRTRYHFESTIRMRTVERWAGQQRRDHGTRGEERRAAPSHFCDGAFLLGQRVGAELVHALLEAGHGRQCSLPNRTPTLSASVTLAAASDYSGMLPCLRCGPGSRLVCSASSAVMTFGRVSWGTITSST
jgi:hypothetical protein